MTLQAIDWVSIIIFFTVSLIIGVAVTKKAGKSPSEFFLSGRNMPWWLLGISMVATTFSADTPNLVTDIVRQNGVAGNWVWWSFLLSGMLTVFVYAKLWRRSGVLTDVEFYEVRYSGKSAAFLRGFRAIYLGIFLNVLVMATVCLAAIKMGAVMLDLTPKETLILASVVTVIYSALGGLRGVILTDFFQFAIAMVGSIFAAYYLVGLPQIGGLSNLLTHSNVADKLSILPDFSQSATGSSSTPMYVIVFLIPLTITWWSAWYPGAEPGGGGYIAQRMLAAKNEKHAIGATLLFNAAMYALRPWPWIIVALCSLIIFPELSDIKSAFPFMDEGVVVRHDLAYPAMLTFLPAGMKGLVLASLMAVFMSTISTHLNWGSSYLVNDFYKRFISHDASENEQVIIGRVSTVILMFLAAYLAIVHLESATQAFGIIIQLGVGTGLVYLLRWFWYRVNPWSEISAMVTAFVIIFYFEFYHVKYFHFEPVADHIKLFLGSGITTFIWVVVTFLTKPSETETLRKFYKMAKPGGPGWKKVIDDAKAENIDINVGKGGDVPLGILCMILGCMSVFGALFATGYWIYGNHHSAILLTGISVTAALALTVLWNKIQTE